MEIQRDAPAPTVDEQMRALAPLLNDAVDARVYLDKTMAEYRALREERDALETKLDGVKKRMAAVQRRLLDKMSEQGVRSVSFPDGTTAYVRFDMYCNKVPGVGGRDLVERLRTAGLEHLISFSPQALKSHIKECMEEKYGDEWAAIPNVDPREVLPADLRDLFNVHTEMKAIVLGLGEKAKE